MTIEVHVKITDSECEIERELAEHIANKIEDIIPASINIPVLIFPLRDLGFKK